MTLYKVEYTEQWNQGSADAWEFADFLRVAAEDAETAIAKTQAYLKKDLEKDGEELRRPALDEQGEAVAGKFDVLSNLTIDSAAALETIDLL